MMIEGIAHDIQPKGNAMTAKKVTNVIEELEADAPETFSAKDLAVACGTDAKSFRRWLRSQTEQRANKGGRWVFTAETKAAYIAAYAARATKGTEPTLPDEG